MNYIYCYTNKINGHKYIGQTNNFQRRIREHRSCAFNPKASSYNDLIHQKIREYGEENFEITILETLYDNDIEEVNQREQYWIEKMNSFRGNGQGYNSDLGGNNRERSRILTPEQIKELKQDIKNGISYYELREKYHMSNSFISSVNHGVYYPEKNEEYPLFKYYKDDTDYDELIELLLNTTLSLAEIARRLNLGYSTVKKINAGTLRRGIYPSYPIRKLSAYAIRAKQIKELLVTTNYSNKEIASIVNCSEETVRRIKVGETFK